ncbi:MAG: carbohydrate binding domain-containing protein, partial [Bacillota bacterium]|nr:carbohydrate binding domain-containing protein [Bacillota bacterium]
MKKLFNPKGNASTLKARSIIAMFSTVCFLMVSVVLTPSVQAASQSYSSCTKEATIKKVIDPSDVHVYNRTPVSDLVKLLPSMVTVVISNNTTKTASVTWDTSKYLEQVKSSKRFNLTGSVEGTKLKANINVIVSSIYVAVIKPLTPIEVPNGTRVEALNLPQYVSAIMSDGAAVNLAVSWDTTGYNGNTDQAVSYQFKGDVMDTANNATITVKVGAPFILSAIKPDPLTVDNGTAAENLALPKEVEVVWSNGIKTSTDIDWDITGYDGNVSEGKTYVFTGTVKGTNITTTIEVTVKALWSLVWSDEFDGNTLNSTKWAYQNGTGAQYGIDGWGNNELESYSPDNIQVRDGSLVITPKLETKDGKPYTSGRLWTSPTFIKKYGKIEARMKLPAGDGFWPAFWMMPKNDAYGGWAASGELDIMEARGRLTNQVSGTLHYGTLWPKNVYSGNTYTFPQGQSITDFHTYSIEWEPGEIRWYVDGVLYQKQNDWYTTGSDGEERYAYPAPFDQDFYIILNLAVGGNFDNGRQPDTSVFNSNPTMQVDYVRTYEMTGRPYKTPADPKIQVQPLPDGARIADSTGNLVNDVNFEKGIKDNQEGIDADFGDGWNFIHNAQFAGQAAVSVEAINDKNYAKVNVTNAGTQPYSIQLEQHTTLGQGRWYKFSFDAKADKNRTLNTKLGGGPDAGWTAYSDSYTVDLTTDVNHFEKVFQMTKASDINTRIEFNCATSSGPVWIGNVRVVEIAAPTVDYNASKEPLPVTGNYIYNGGFDKYTVNKMAYWNFTKAVDASADAYVPEATRELNVDITNGGADLSTVTVDQRGLKLEKNNGYDLTFNARASVDRTAKVQITSKDGTAIFAEKDINLTAAMTTFELSFNMAGNTDLESKLVFMLGGTASKVYIDNVKLIKTTVDYTGVDIYPLKNGNFSQGLTGWQNILDSGGTASFSAADGPAKIDITNPGLNPWSVMLMQDNMSLVKGIEYTLSFRAKSSVNRNMLVTLENAAYTRAFEAQGLNLTTEWQTFSYTIKPSVSEALALKYQLGNVDNTAANGTVYIDDVVLQVKNPPVKQAPMLVADNTDNMIGNAIDISFADDGVWRTAVTEVKINGQVLSKNQYSITAGNINFPADNFTTAASYTISVEADGYAGTSVVQSVIPNDGKLVRNGTFDSNTDGWTTWLGDGSDAVVTTEGGQMKVSFTNYDGYWRWSTQVYQTGIKLEAGKTYVIKFDARSTINKNVLLEVNKGTTGNYYVSPEIALTTSNNTYTYEFTTTEADINAKLNFLLGSNNAAGPNFAGQSVYLDNISIEEKTTIPPVTSNIIVNGYFDTSIAPWDSYSDGSVTAASAGGEAKIDINGFGPNPWSVQFFQDKLNFEPNARYNLSFKARA